jgi:hypothetical protein
MAYLRSGQYVCTKCGKGVESLNELRHHATTCPGMQGVKESKEDRIPGLILRSHELSSAA